MPPNVGPPAHHGKGGDTPDPTSRAKIVIHPADGRYTRRMADTPGGWQTQKPNLNLENLKL